MKIDIPVLARLEKLAHFRFTLIGEISMNVWETEAELFTG